MSGCGNRCAAARCRTPNLCPHTHRQSQDHVGRHDPKAAIATLSSAAMARAGPIRIRLLGLRADRALGAGADVGGVAGVARRGFRARSLRRRTRCCNSRCGGERGDGIGAFIGPAFDPGQHRGYLAAWRSNRAERPRLSIRALIIALHNIFRRLRWMWANSSLSGRGRGSYLNKTLIKENFYVLSPSWHNT